MIHLLFVVPYPELQDKVETVLKNHPDRDNIQADVRVMMVDETTSVDPGGYDAIIARGYSAKHLKESNPQIPVIDLAITGLDIFQTVAECQQKYGAKRIAICGSFGRIYETYKSCEQLLGCEVELFTPEYYDELENTVKEIITRGFDAMICGYFAGKYAAGHQFPYYIINTTADTVAQSINEAVRTVEEVQKQRIIAQTYKTIIYAAKDGILYVDRTGIIRVRNHTVREMNNNISLMHKTLTDTFPVLQYTFEEVLKTKQEVNGEIYRLEASGITVSASFVPVIVKQEVSGVVITLTDITDIQRLENQIRRTLSEKGLQAKYSFDDIIHESDVIEETIRVAKRYAASESNVIIVGETGTGKELFAQSIHNASSRKNGPFVAINCAALPENLLESELFGYVEGAFTGTAKGGKVGLFEQAHGGTLFLDEIGEISLAIQTKLLRVLQEREVRRIGDNKVISVNVRIVSATNRSIHHLIDQGMFRKDLAYRLDVLRIFLPPLRQRGNDVDILFLHLLKQLGMMNHRPVPKVDEDAFSVLHGYPFNGNIRELRNIVERAGVICEDDRITRETLMTAVYPKDLENDTEKGVYLDRTASEREQILWALEETAGNQTEAARQLGIDRSTLWRKMKKYGLK